MALSGHDDGDVLGWDEEDMSSLTKSGHVLKEEHMGLWADANKAKVCLFCFLLFCCFVVLFFLFVLEECCFKT